MQFMLWLKDILAIYKDMVYFLVSWKEMLCLAALPLALIEKMDLAQY